MYLKSVAILSVFALAACGGGGGGSTSSNPPTPPPPVAQYPLDSAVSALEQMNQNYNLNATSGGNNYTLQLGSQPGPQSTFNGQPALTATKTLALSENGTLLINDISTDYFTISPFTPFGAVDQSTGRVTVNANQIALPQLATVGQSGAFDTFTIYTDNTLTTIYATGTNTWSLQADTSTTAFGCLNDTINYAAGGSSTESDCYQMDENGNVLSLQITLLVNGVTLNFQ